MDEQIRDPKDYEIGFLAKDDKGAEGVLATLKKLGAEILLEGPVEKIALAYKVKHETTAWFGYIHFRVLPETAAEVRKELSANPLVLRFLIVTPPFEKPKPRWDGGKSRGTKAAVQPTAPEHAKTSSGLPLSNEALEKQIEEILK